MLGTSLLISRLIRSRTRAVMSTSYRQRSPEKSRTSSISNEIDDTEAFRKLVRKLSERLSKLDSASLISASRMMTAHAHGGVALSRAKSDPILMNLRDKELPVAEMTRGAFTPPPVSGRTGLAGQSSTSSPTSSLRSRDESRLNGSGVSVHAQEDSRRSRRALFNGSPGLPNGYGGSPGVPNAHAPRLVPRLPSPVHSFDSSGSKSTSLATTSLTTEPQLEKLSTSPLVDERLSLSSLPMDRAVLRVDAFDTYGVMSTVVMSTAFGGLQSLPEFGQNLAEAVDDFEQTLNLACRFLLMGSVALSAYSTIIFALNALYLKSTFGSGRDAQFAAFFAATAVDRRHAFCAFIASVATFGLAFVCVGAQLMSGRPTLQWAVLIGSVPVTAYMALHVLRVVSLARRLLFSGGGAQTSRLS